MREHYPQKTIWCYSGYLFDEDMLKGRLGDPSITMEMLGYLDVLVDGEFVLSEKDSTCASRAAGTSESLMYPALSRKRGLSFGTVRNLPKAKQTREEMLPLRGLFSISG